MTKKTVTEVINGEPFNPKIVSRIIEEANTSDASPDPINLSCDLNEIAETYQILLILDQDKSLRQKLRQLSKIIKHASHFVTALEEVTDDTRIHLYEAAEVSPIKARTIVREAKENAEVLAQWAKSACKVLDSSIAMSSQVTYANAPSARVWLVAIGLPEVYEKHYGRPWGYSQPAIDKGLPGGPGMLFSRKCLKVMGIEMSPAAIAKSRKRCLGDNVE